MDTGASGLRANRCEGNGALAAQSTRTGEGPNKGAVTQVDVETGAWTTLARGLRNPSRMALSPGGKDLWIAEAGWNDVEEIDRLPLGEEAPLNFGWPCYEGSERNALYAAAAPDACRPLYEDRSAVTGPWYSYRHSDVSGDEISCETGSAAISGIAYARGDTLGPGSDGTLIFSDFVRGCIWAMSPDDQGLPDPSRVILVSTDFRGPVDLETAPDGSVYVVYFYGGEIRRLEPAGIP